MLGRAARRRRAGAGRDGAFLPGGDLSGLDRHGAAARHRLRALRAGARRCAIPTLAGAARCTAWRAPTARASSCCSRGDGARRRGRARAARGRAATTCTSTNGRAAPTTCCGGAASSACTSAPPSARRVARWCAAHWPARSARRRRRRSAHGADARAHRAAGRRATWLYPLDLTLVPRAVTVLLGATQAGKTTLMRVMAGLDAPTKGRVLADGQRRDRHAGARAQRGDGLPAVHQLPVDDGGRQHRLAAEAARREEHRRARRASSPPSCTSSPSSTACRPSCRAASSSASRWRARWPRTRR